MYLNNNIEVTYIFYQIFCEIYIIFPGNISKLNKLKNFFLLKLLLNNLLTIFILFVIYNCRHNKIQI